VSSTAISRSGRSREDVGAPRAEAELTCAVVDQIGDLYRPGLGRSLFVVPEAALGQGRPDLVVLCASPSAMRAIARSSLRLPSFVAARAMDPNVPVDRHSVTPKHVALLRRSLESQGWSASWLDRWSRSLYWSTTIEVKVRDWSRGVAQASRYGRFAHTTDLVIRERGLTATAESVIRKRGVGLVVETENGLVRRAPSAARHPGRSEKAWLVELLLRSIEVGDAYTPSADLKELSALLSASTRPRYGSPVK